MEKGKERRSREGRGREGEREGGRKKEKTYSKMLGAGVRTTEHCPLCPALCLTIQNFSLASHASQSEAHYTHKPLLGWRPHLESYVRDFAPTCPFLYHSSLRTPDSSLGSCPPVPSSLLPLRHRGQPATVPLCIPVSQQTRMPVQCKTLGMQLTAPPLGLPRAPWRRQA